MAAPARSVENLGRNLRALIQELVVETRKANFKQNDPATQNLLKRFASQAHTYQVAAKNAGKKLNANQARANLSGNNAAAAAAAATVENVAGSAAEAAKANATPSALRARLVAMKSKAAAAIRNLRAPKPAAPPVFGPAPRPLGNKVRAAFTRAPVNYNKIIAAYNKTINNNVKRSSIASKWALNYKISPGIKKNFTNGGKHLTKVMRGGAAGRYESRQKFLNEMAAFYKKQVNNRKAFENTEAARVAAANADARAANADARAANVHRTIARELYNRSKLNNSGKRKNVVEIWSSIPANIRNKMQDFKKVESVLNTYAANINNTERLAKVRKQINYAKRVLRNSATGEAGMAASVAPIFGPNTQAVAAAAAARQKPPPGRLISRGKFMVGPDEVAVFRHIKGPANVFYGRASGASNYRKLKRNATNPGKFNFNNLNTRFYKNTNTGFEPTDLQKLANDYVKNLYSKTGRLPWGTANAKNIVENKPMNKLIVQRKNITNAALQRFLVGPNKPTQRNANKRIAHLREIITTAHQFGAARDALLNIAAKKGPLDEIVKTNTLATLNSNQLKKRSENINSRFVEYNNAVQRASSLLNAKEIEQVAKVSTQLERSVQTAKAAVAAAALAKKIIANLNGKNGASLAAAITKAKNDIKNIPNGTNNRTSAQAAINAANAKAAAAAAAAPSALAATTRRGLLGALPNARARDPSWGWTINASFNKAYAKNTNKQSNLYIQKANGYRKVNNPSTGNFNNTQIYNWDPMIPNFAKR